MTVRARDDTATGNVDTIDLTYLLVVQVGFVHNSPNSDEDVKKTIVIDDA